MPNELLPHIHKNLPHNNIQNKQRKTKTNKTILSLFLQIQTFLKGRTEEEKHDIVS